MNILAELNYSKDHVWVRVEGNTAYIGITDFAKGELYDIVFVDIDKEVEDVDDEDIFGLVEAVKTVSDLYMPISGKIESVNEALADDPEKVNNDPYGEGWMVKVTMSNASDIDNLMTADQYKDHIGG